MFLPKRTQNGHFPGVPGPPSNPRPSQRTPPPLPMGVLPGTTHWVLGKGRATAARRAAPPRAATPGRGSLGAKDFSSLRKISYFRKF